MTVDSLALSRAYPGALWRNETRRALELPGTVAERVAGRLGRLRKLWRLHRPDRDEAEEAADFLEEDQAAWLRPNPGESPAHWKQKPKLTTNFAAKALRDVATVYQSAPRRLVTGDLGEAQRIELEAWLEEHLWEYGAYGLDATLKELDRWLLYHGTIAIEARYQPGLEALPSSALTDVPDGVELIFYRRHEFEALPFDDDPRTAEAVVFPVRSVERTDVRGVAARHDVMHYWDGEVFARLVDWTPERPADVTDSRWHGEVFEHGLGRLPVLFLRESIVQRQFYAPGVHVNLFRLSKELNKLKTEHGYMIKVPGTFYHQGKLDRVDLGADTITIGPEPGTGGPLQYVAMAANLEQIRLGIQQEIDDLAVAFGLSPGSLVMDPQAARSGVAILAEQRDTEALRAERVPMWSRFEHRFHEIAAAIYEVYSPDSPPPQLLDGTSGLTVIHQRPPSQLSDAERRDQLEWERKHGLIGKEDMLKEARPDLTDEEIEARLARVAEAAPDMTPSPVDEAADPEAAEPDDTDNDEGDE